MLLLVLLSFSVSAQFSCQAIDTMSGSCSGSTIFKLSSASNAHVELPTETYYDFSLCCESTSLTLSNSCVTGTPILKLSATTNAHAERVDYVPASYPEQACISINSTSLPCSYTAACAATEICVATISSDTNAHVADCTTDPYTTKICCSCSGKINGTVQNVGDEPLVGATVDLLVGESVLSTTTTDASGNYGFEPVACGTYAVRAIAETYLPKVVEGVFVGIGTTTINFIDGTALDSGTECDPDCTFAGDNLIHKSCSGINGCNFYDNQSADACDLAQPGWKRDYNATYEVVCAEGAPTKKQSAGLEVKCEEENLVKITRIVTYYGRPVKMVVVTCG